MTFVAFLHLLSVKERLEQDMGDRLNFIPPSYIRPLKG